MTKKQKIIDGLHEMTQGYLICALWASTDDEGRPLDDHYQVEDFTIASLRKAEKDCKKFLSENAQQVENFRKYGRFDWGQVGHDFFLTSRRHGAGFWDRKAVCHHEAFKSATEHLTNEAHKYSEESPYAYKGKVHFFDENL